MDDRKEEEESTDEEGLKKGGGRTNGWPAENPNEEIAMTSTGETSATKSAVTEDGTTAPAT